MDSPRYASPTYLAINGRVQDRFLPSGCKRQGIVVGGEVVQAISPKGLDALAWMDAAEGQDYFRAGGDQNIPDCSHREPTAVLHPASITPEPMKITEVTEGAVIELIETVDVMQSVVVAGIRRTLDFILQRQCAPREKHALFQTRGRQRKVLETRHKTNTSSFRFSMWTHRGLPRPDSQSG